MKNTLAKCNEDAYLPSLHLSTVELRCKLQEKLHRMSWPTLLRTDSCNTRLSDYNFFSVAYEKRDCSSSSVVILETIGDRPY